VEHRGGGIIEWVIEDLPRGSRFLAATVQQADQNSPAPFLGDVVFVQHSAALSADGRKVRLIFEHDSSREICAYASLWLSV
jgi:lipopolysaccharide export system protein LptA